MFRRFRKLNKAMNQGGQALIEYLLVILLALGFAHFIFFNKTFGVQPNFERTMLQIGGYLEANLRSGTKVGPQGTSSNHEYAGDGNWNN